MSFTNNCARVKYVKYLRRAPTGDFGPSEGATAPLTIWTLRHWVKGREVNLLHNIPLGFQNFGHKIFIERKTTFTKERKWLSQNVTVKKIYTMLVVK